MPTTTTDVFFVIDPFNSPPVGTSLTAVSFDVTDQNDNGLINRFSNDSIDGFDIRASYPGDTVTISTADGDITYVGVTFYLADGREVFTPTDGQTLVDGTFGSSTFVTTQDSVTPEELEAVCFTAGTLIATPAGLRAVEPLQLVIWLRRWTTVHKQSAGSGGPLRGRKTAMHRSGSEKARLATKEHCASHRNIGCFCRDGRLSSILA